MNYIYHYPSPVGLLTICSNENALTALNFEESRYSEAYPLSDSNILPKPVIDAIRWLNIYFSGKIPDFIPETQLTGSPFRLEVWNIIREIPYGQTTTYGEIARKIAQKRNIPRMSAQAVGGAVGHNPIGIIIPCHRVIGADNSLTGFSGGLNKKITLLKIEHILEKLKKELDELIIVKRKEVAQKLKEARSYGDLSENAEYDEAKNEQAILESQIAELQHTLDNAEVVEDSNISVDEVGMSSVIKIRRVGTDKIETFTIVGTNQANVKEGKLSDESPIGKAAMRKKVGDIFIVEAPAGELRFEILEISK